MVRTPCGTLLASLHDQPLKCKFKHVALSQFAQTMESPGEDFVY